MFFEDKEQIEELAEKWGLKLVECWTGYPEVTTVYDLINIVGTFKTLEETRDWLIREFEEK